jgi:hypothetical protein
MDGIDAKRWSNEVELTDVAVAVACNNGRYGCEVIMKLPNR